MALTRVTPDVLDFSKPETFSGNVTVTAAIIANGSAGTVGQALVSTGNGVYWAYAQPGQDYGLITGSLTTGSLDYGSLT